MINGTDILLIEDNPQDVEVTLRVFQKYHLGSQIHVVEDGEEALECLFSTGRYADRSAFSKPRLILLDLKLPKVDGMEVLHQCKADPRTKNLPVVILSSSREECDLLESYHLGVNSYVVKSVDYTQFTEAVRQVALYWLLLNQVPAEVHNERREQ